jgi:uncharacterized membrane protein YdbT with pleckstrin-like domain
MAYYTKVLLPGESVRIIGRLHWAIYIRAWFCLIIAALATIDFLYLRSRPADGASDTPVSLIALGITAFFLFFGLFFLLVAWNRRKTTEIVVTDRRIIFKEGFIRRRTMEMNMSKVETVDVVQSIPGRLLNYGTILIRGVGSSYEPLRLVSDPLAFRTAIIAQ